jgi:ribosomal protein S6
MPTNKEAPEGARVYEIGVHYISSLPEADVTTAFESLTTALKGAGAEIITEESPRLKTLAYTMVKHLAGKNVKYTTAYFGWVKFELSSEKIAEMKEKLDHDENVLRYIIIKTIRENTLHGHKFVTETPKREGRRDRTESRDSITMEPISEKAEEVAPVSEAEVDKAIDELVTE